MKNVESTLERAGDIISWNSGGVRERGDEVCLCPGELRTWEAMEMAGAGFKGQWCWGGRASLPSLLVF